MGLKELLKQKLAEIKALQEAHPEGMPEAEFKQAKGLMAEAEALRGQIEMDKKLRDGTAFLEDPANAPKAAAVEWTPDNTKKDDEPAYDGKSYREVEVKTIAGAKTIRYNVPLCVQGEGYKSAFDALLRSRGNLDQLGPNDRKALSEGIDIDGGFLVPPDYLKRIIQKTATNAVIRSFATVLTTSKDLVKIPRINYTTDDKYTSPIRFSWVGEVPASTDHRVTNPVFGEVDVQIHKAMASILISNDLISDSDFDVQGIVTEKIGEAFAVGEDDVFINGNGVKKPMGILTQVDGNGPASVSSGSAAALLATGIISLFYTVPAQYRQAAKFVMSSSTMSAVEKLVDSDGRYIISSLVNGASLAAGMFEHIKGHQVLADEFVPTVAAGSNSIIFGDLSGYWIFDRVGLSIEVNKSNFIDTDQTLIVAKKRVGGYTAEPFKLKVQTVEA